MLTRTLTRALAGSAAAVLLSLGVQVPAAAAQPLDDYDQKMVQLINAERARFGRPPVQYFAPLRVGSLDHSEWMLSTGRFEHDSGVSGDVAGTGCGGAGGGNIAHPVNPAPHPAAKNTGYIYSPRHPDKILNPQLRDLPPRTGLQGGHV